MMTPAAPARSFPQTVKLDAVTTAAKADDQSGRFQNLKRDLHQKIITGLDISRLSTMSQDDVRAEIRRAAEELSRTNAGLLNMAERERLVNEVVDETFRLGTTRATSARQVDFGHSHQRSQGDLRRAKRTLAADGCRVHDDKHLLQIIQRIVGRIGRRVDESSPMVDARLEDGSRVNAIIPPLALDGSLVSIRRFPDRPMQAEDLIARKSVARVMIDFLAAAVKGRCNILISGGTGSGKTTLLNLLSGYIPRRSAYCHD
jgi:pilus assembly protein CpaF